MKILRAFLFYFLFCFEGLGAACRRNPRSSLSFSLAELAACWRESTLLLFSFLFCFVLGERDDDTHAVMLYEENDDDGFSLVMAQFHNLISEHPCSPLCVSLFQFVSMIML